MCQCTEKPDERALKQELGNVNRATDCVRLCLTELTQGHHSVMLSAVFAPFLCSLEAD